MKSFRIQQDLAYVVPALRTLGTGAAWPRSWGRQSAVIAAVLALHVLFFWAVLRMTVVTPPESLPMSETEVVLESLNNEPSTAAEPVPAQPTVERHARVVEKQVEASQKLVREAEMSKPTPANTSINKSQATSEPIAVKSSHAPITSGVSPATTSNASESKPAASNQGRAANVSFNPKPPYPKDLEKTGIGGTVGLLIQVNAQGRASSVTVTRSSGQAALDASARETVLNRWKFKPAQSGTGESVASSLVQAIRFQPQ